MAVFCCLFTDEQKTLILVKEEERKRYGKLKFF